MRSDCEGAIVEAITECYTNGTYTKVPEFLGFRRREASSRTFLEADCEHGLLMMRQALIEGLSMTTKVQQAADGIVQRVAGIVSDDIECFRRDSAHESAVNEDLSQLPQWLPPLSCTRCAPTPLYNKHDKKLFLWINNRLIQLFMIDFAPTIPIILLT